jgi:MATE family multidrug resistance protein
MLVALFCAMVEGILAMTFTTTMLHVWGWLFTADQSILSLTAMAMPIVGLCELGNCPQTTGCGVLRGSTRPSTGENINLGSFYMVGMPVAMLLGFIFNTGLVSLWLGLLASSSHLCFLNSCPRSPPDRLESSSSQGQTIDWIITPNDTLTYHIGHGQ